MALTRLSNAGRKIFFLFGGARPCIVREGFCSYSLSMEHQVRKPAARISAKLRHAVELQVREGLLAADACAKAGMTLKAYKEATKRPAVQEFIDRTQCEFVAEVEQMQALYRARALTRASHLMEHAESETVQVKMAQFIIENTTPQSKQAHSKNTKEAQPPGYSYPRPSGR